MTTPLLKVEHLSTAIEEGELLHDVSLEIGEGETHVLMGPNGAGKSTFGNTLMGNPNYKVTGGRIWFDGEDITELSADKRAAKGLFLSFQNPLEVPGLSLEAFLRNAIRQRTGKPLKIFQFKKELEQTMELLQMDEAYADRDLNVGFSGGEKKKAEILQLLMLDPRLAMLDETDSGLDVDAVKTVAAGIRAYHNENNALIIITHNAKILEGLDVDYVHILNDKHIVRTGGAELIRTITEQGFEAVKEAE